MTSISKFMIHLAIATFSLIACVSCESIEQESGLSFISIAPPDFLEGFSLTQCNRDDMYHIDNCSTKETFAISLHLSIFEHTERIVPHFSISGTESSANNFSYTGGRLSKIKEYVYSDPDFLKIYIGPWYMDAGILSEIKVFADKSLFGRAPGEDISDHVILNELDQRSYIIASFPDADFLGKAEPGMYIKDYLKVGTLIPGDVNIASFVFDELPSDLPKDFSITFEIPLDLAEGVSSNPNVILGPDWVKPEDTFVYRPSVQIHLD